MSACVIDASVVARWFLGDESDATVKQALAVRTDYRAGRLNLHAPELLSLEVCNVFWKQVRFGGLVPADAERAAAQLASYEFVFHPHAALARNALEVALDHRISVYDAAYVAVAKRGALPLVTLDLKLARAVGDVIEVRIPAIP